MTPSTVQTCLKSSLTCFTMVSSLFRCKWKGLPHWGTLRDQKHLYYRFFSRHQIILPWRMRQIWMWHPKACLNPGQSVVRKLPKRPKESRSSYPAHCHIISNSVQPCAISSNHFRMCWRYLHTYFVNSQSSLKINQCSVFSGFSGLCVQIQLKMVTLTPGNTYMGVASFLWPDTYPLS